MPEAESTPPAPRQLSARDLRRQIDERDETIRLLNEALSAALAELEREGRIAA
jgi:hypothetical protein